jgi:hypothetical protein
VFFEENDLRLLGVKNLDSKESGCKFDSCSDYKQVVVPGKGKSLKADVTHFCL